MGANPCPRRQRALFNIANSEKGCNVTLYCIWRSTRKALNRQQRSGYLPLRGNPDAEMTPPHCLGSSFYPSSACISIFISDSRACTSLPALEACYGNRQSLSGATTTISQNTDLHPNHYALSAFCSRPSWSSFNFGRPPPRITPDIFAAETGKACLQNCFPITSSRASSR